VTFYSGSGVSDVPKKLATPVGAFVNYYSSRSIGVSVARLLRPVASGGGKGGIAPSQSQSFAPPPNQNIVNITYVSLQPTSQCH